MVPSKWLPSAAATLVFFASTSAWANPQGGQVVGGTATINQVGNTVTVNQASQRAVINWTGFSINNGELTRFNQPGANAAVLNRVLGGNPSAIYGTLSSNGKVFLINPNGILVGPSGIIDTRGGFVGSTLDIPDSGFMSGGDLNFAGQAITTVVNYGTIKSAQGDVALIGFKVENHGSIETPEGKTMLGAGQNILLKAEGADRLYVQSSLETVDDSAETGIDQQGVIKAASAELKAAGNNVYALAVNNEGTVDATGFETVEGRIILTSDGGNISVAGTLRAMQADGDGGEVLIGGEYQGSDPERIANAHNVLVVEDTVIEVKATSANGDGGRAIIWADNATGFFGRIDGRGGSDSGDGAFAEVSGKQYLVYEGFADLTAANGKTGTLLLDPINVEITDAAGEQNNTASGGFVNTLESDGNAPTRISTNTVETALAGADVKISTNAGGAGADAGDITVSSAINWSSNNALIFDADNSITINASITSSSGGNLNLFDSDSSTRGSGNVTTAAGAALTANEIAVATAGNVSFGGALSTPLLRIHALGVGGSFTANNTSNTITQLALASGTQMTGDVSIFDSAGGLNVRSSSLNTTGSVTLRTVGDLSINDGHSITAGGNIILEASGGTFTASNPVTLTAPRYLIYASSLNQGNLSPTSSKANYSNDPLGSGNVFYQPCTTDCATGTTEEDAFGTDSSSDQENAKNNNSVRPKLVMFNFLGDTNDSDEEEESKKEEKKTETLEEINEIILTDGEEFDPDIVINTDDPNKESELEDVQIGSYEIPGVPSDDHLGFRAPTGSEGFLDDMADGAFASWVKDNPGGTRSQFDGLLDNGDQAIQGAIISQAMLTWVSLKGLPDEVLSPEQIAFKQGLAKFISVKKKEMAAAAKKEYEKIVAKGQSNLGGMFRKSFPDVVSIISDQMVTKDPIYSAKLAGILTGTVGSTVIAGAGATGIAISAISANATATGGLLIQGGTTAAGGGAAAGSGAGAGIGASAAAGPAAIIAAAVVVGIYGAVNLEKDNANQVAYETLQTQARAPTDLAAMDASEMGSWIAMMMVAP